MNLVYSIERDRGWYFVWVGTKEDPTKKLFATCLTLWGARRAVRKRMKWADSPRGIIEQVEVKS